jgi:N-acetylglucosamine kinase-like BadF-type ATPase
MATILICDSGATKAEWCLIRGNKKKTIFTQGVNPYFLDTKGIQDIVQNELLKKLKNAEIDAVHFYGTGCANPHNAKNVKKALTSVFTDSDVTVETDLMGAARAVCGNEKGIASILGTGSNSCYYNGKKIVKNSPGLGYVLGDEGSGAYLGKKVLQYYLYETFDEDLRTRFDAKFLTTPVEILDRLYKKQLTNSYITI